MCDLKGGGEGGCCPPCEPAITLHPLAAHSVLQITGGRGQLQRPVESRRARLLCILAAWSIFTEAATSCTEQITPAGSQRCRKGIEHPVNFQNQIPCADSRFYKNEKLPDQRKCLLNVLKQKHYFFLLVFLVCLFKIRWLCYVGSSVTFPHTSCFKMHPTGQTMSLHQF